MSEKGWCCDAARVEPRPGTERPASYESSIRQPVRLTELAMSARNELLGTFRVDVPLVTPVAWLVATGTPYPGPCTAPDGQAPPAAGLWGDTPHRSAGVVGPGPQKPGNQGETRF